MSVREIKKTHVSRRYPAVKFDYTIRITSRAKTARIKTVDDGTVIIVVPEFVLGAEEFGEQIAISNELTIHQNLMKLKQAARERKKTPQPAGNGIEFIISDGQDLKLFGKTFKARVIRELPPGFPKGMIAARIAPEINEARFMIDEEIDEPERAAGKGWESQLKGEMMKEVSQYLASPHIQEFLKKHNVYIAKITPRTMKSQWGSCTSARQTIRINTLLAQLPPECLHYVLDHEIVHLVEANHQKRFYQLLNQLNPQAARISAHLDSLIIGRDGTIRERG